MDAESDIFLLEALDLLSSTTVLGALYGIVFTLYCLCTRQLCLNLQKPDSRRRAGFSLGYISLLFFCATGILALSARMTQVFYIDHVDFPGGPLQYERSHSSSDKLYFATLAVLNYIVEVLTAVIQIRRLWIIWSGTQHAVVITILPVLLLLSYMALDIQTDTVASIVPIERLGISFGAAIAMTTASFVALSAFTILVTGLIAARLLLVRRQQMKILGTSEAANPYLSIVATLIESYALEAAWSLATAISLAVDSPSDSIFGTNDSIIKIIAYFLVVYRVETGRGWTQKTNEKLTSLQWNRGAQTATDEASGIQSRGPATTIIVGINSELSAHRPF